MQTTLQQWSERADSLSEEDRSLIIASAEDRWVAVDDGDRKVGLAGRGNVTRINLVDGPNLIVREFLRGGLLSQFCRRTFLRPIFRSGKRLPTGVTLSGYRPFDELRVLDYLRQNGVSVPAPVAAFVSESFLFYRGVIVLEEVPSSRNLLDIVRGDTEAPLSDLASEAGHEAWKMLNLGVRHTDLHIGNVLLNANGAVVVIDLDKAVCMNAKDDIHSARRLLIERWTRSCKKHGCPELVKPFSQGMLDD